MKLSGWYIYQINLFLAYLPSLGGSTPVARSNLEERISVNDQLWVSRVNQIVAGRLLMTIQLGNCPGPLPGSPFPAFLNPLRPYIVNRGGKLELQYIDHNGYYDVIEDKESLCDAAGCRCRGPSLTCGHTDGAYYEPLFARAYAEICFHTCHCEPFPPAVDDGVIVDAGDVQVMETQRNGSADVGGYGPEAIASGKEKCLKGKHAGWTLQKYALKSCCPGTKFQAITGQEAYLNFKVAQTLGELIAGQITIGVCL